MPGAARKKHHAPFPEMLQRLVLGEQLREGTADKRRKHSRAHAYGAEYLRHVDTVHDRGQHADLIRLGAVDVPAGSPSPEITSSGDDPYLNAVPNQLPHLQGHPSDGFLVKPCLPLSCQRLSAELQHYPTHQSPPFFPPQSTLGPLRPPAILCAEPVPCRP